tara:strand:+ start:651 stop:923 length:273 start_codon:yes stop_codon:yes gene_type:complete
MYSRCHPPIIFEVFSYIVVPDTLGLDTVLVNPESITHAWIEAQVYDGSLRYILVDVDVGTITSNTNYPSKEVENNNLFNPLRCTLLGLEP